ncbi:hypothetical protein ADEAN_000740600 [Angomonas deanei]|uniref:Surface antigen-like protein n=1 Tax=Angomonas deanei TaxID=59799 RepID=A0A7G2CMV8_9TRYP|nr:hypothetical protein ADEAN_000740600 [Angomonas deanei]
MPSLRSLAVLLVLLTLHSASALFCFSPCKTCTLLHCATCIENHHIEVIEGVKFCVNDCNVTHCKTCSGLNKCVLCDAGYFATLGGDCKMNTSEATTVRTMTQWVVLAVAVVAGLCVYAF